jgi:hypothetical protein
VYLISAGLGSEWEDCELNGYKKPLLHIFRKRSQSKDSTNRSTNWEGSEVLSLCACCLAANTNVMNIVTFFIL